MRGALACVGALVVLALVPRVGRPQGVAGQVAIDAEVIGQAITITSLRNLDFGSVLKGVTTTVLPTAATAGEWQVQGTKNAQVSVAFTLPTQLVNIQALPGSTMPISFTPTSARWNRATNDVAGATAFDPTAGATGKLGPPANPFLYVWIGGTVLPAPTAKPGIYTGTIIVSIAYL
jgi:spore coat protein U-like protein